MSFKSDENVFCRVCCFLRQKGLTDDKFSLEQVPGTLDEFKFIKWVYNIDTPTEQELSEIDDMQLQCMKKLACNPMTELAIYSQEELDMYVATEGNFCFNSTSGFLVLYKNGTWIEI